MPENNTEQQRFDATMKKILSVSKQELQRRLEAEKRVRIPSLSSRSFHRHDSSGQVL
jgi:hypothetical protein